MKPSTRVAFTLAPMKPEPRFHRELLLVTLVTAAGLGVLYTGIDDLKQRVGYLVVLPLAFAAFTWVAQFVAERMARGEKPQQLLNFVMVLTFAKMAFSLALVYGYYLNVRPASKAFLWPFFLVYLAYTSFETYALIRLSFATAPTRSHDQ